MSDIILMTENYPLLLTLTLDEKAFAHFDAMRRRFFPPHRNKVPAHITLFHTLPGAQTDSVSALLEQTAAARKAFPMRTNGLMFLGGGVAYTVESPDAQALRAELAGHWLEFLTPQDKNRPVRPHITVQNRVK
ncbi:MAG: 2-5 ligase family protein, partial [Alphaproteobacteria bacterium]|nr:2-5 ligase family protein [Alphaproteobacteria bacterium]